MTILGANRPVVGVVGAGLVARLHLDAWRELNVPVRILSPSGANEVAAEYRDAVVARSWGELLERCSVIDICTPTDVHAALAADAIAARRHVICEKPLALDARSAAGLAAAAANAGVLLLPAHVGRFVPAYEALHDAVRSGRLGTVVFARFTRASRAPGSGGWVRNDERSGGIIFDQTISDIDQALWTAGPVARVLARRTVWPNASGTASTMLVLSHLGGAITHIVGIWGPPRTPFRTTYRVTGTTGTLTHDSIEVPALRLRGSTVEPPGAFVDTGLASPFTAELAEFLRAVIAGVSPRVDASDGVAAVAVAAAARESAATGRAVRIPRVTQDETARAAL